MSFHSWLQNLRSGLAPDRGHRRRPRRSATHRPCLEVLEDRTVLSGYQQINLAGYQAGMAHFTDPNLNGWGMTSLPDGTFVVSNAFTTGLATFYNRSGARSARRQRCLAILSQIILERENETCRSTVGCSTSAPPSPLARASAGSPGDLGRIGQALKCWKTARFPAATSRSTWAVTSPASRPPTTPI